MCVSVCACVCACVLSFVSKLHFYCDILSHLSILIQLFQRPNVLPHEVDEYVASTIDAVRSDYLHGDVPCMGLSCQHFTQQLSSVILAQGDEKDGNNTFYYSIGSEVHSHRIKFTANDINAFKVYN